MPFFKRSGTRKKGKESESEVDVEMFPRNSDNSLKTKQNNLLSSMLNKNLDIFEEILSCVNVDPDDYYDDPKDHIQKTCLDIGCSEPGYSEYVQLLLDHGSDVNKFNPFLKKIPLFLAVETGDISTLRVLLSNYKLKVNIVIDGKTALNLANDIKDSVDESPNKIFEIQMYKKIISMLKKAKARVNCGHMKDSFSNMGIANLVIPTGMAKKIKEDIDLLPRCAIRDELISLLRHNEEGFINKFEECTQNEESSHNFSLQEEKYALLKIACENRFDRAVNTIIQHQYEGALTSSNKNNYKNIGEFAALACRNGDHKTLKIFLENKIKFTVKSESLLQITIKSKQQTKRSKDDYDECIKLLVKDERELLNINYLDFLHDTALHHAIRYGDEETTMVLLKKGASINVRNVFDEFPISKMSSEALQQFLDACVKLKTSNSRLQDEDEKISFDYRFLVPPNRARSENFMDKPREVKCNSQLSYVPETEVLLYMSEQPRFRKLLGHPVIMCFLFLKWQRVRYFHWINTAFYSMFYTAIMLQAFLGAQNEHIFEVYILTRILLTLLTIRESIQFVVFPKSYFFKRENWLEVLLIAVSWLAIHGPENHRRETLSVAILISSLELFSMVGKFPRWSLYVEMLRTVTINFIKFFLWYSFVILAFGLCFYVLFRSDEEKKKSTQMKFDMSRKENGSFTHFHVVLQSNSTDDEEADSFGSPGLSIFKTIIMLASEFDASTINFDHYPMVTYPMFVIFIFTISIVLMNLLNGLAVSDIQKITADAQLWSYVYQVQMISFFEKFFLGENKLELRIPRSMEWIHHKIYTFIGNILFSRFKRTICRFPGYEPNLLITVKIDNSIDISTKKINQNEDNESKKSCCRKLMECFHLTKIFKSSIKENILNLTNTIIDEKLKDIDIQEKIKMKMDIVEKKLNRTEVLLEKIDSSIKKYEKDASEINEIIKKIMIQKLDHLSNEKKNEKL